MNGAFQTAACDAGRAGTCLRQMAPNVPIRWTGESYDAPYTLIGDQTWSNYTVKTDALFEQAGSVELIGRANLQGTNNNGLNAYHLRVGNTGAWSIVKSDNSWNFTTLASGTTSALGLNTWHTVAFQLNGSTLTASVDGRTVGSVNDSTWTNGQAGLGVTGYQTDEFDNFSITPGSTQVVHQGPVTSARRASAWTTTAARRPTARRPDVRLQQHHGAELVLGQRLLPTERRQRQVPGRHRQQQHQRHAGRSSGTATAARTSSGRRSRTASWWASHPASVWTTRGSTPPTPRNWRSGTATTGPTSRWTVP